MTSVVYRTELPYAPERILAQYFDLEHLEHVHPQSFGRARLLGVRDRTVRWQLETPSWLGVCLRTTIEQEYVPPCSVRARVVSGVLKGARVWTTLAASPTGTRIHERYELPWPAWSWVRRLAQRWLCGRLDRIWREDLAVGMCHGGWPGVPG